MPGSLRHSPQPTIIIASRMYHPRTKDKASLAHHRQEAHIISVMSKPSCKATIFPSNSVDYFPVAWDTSKANRRTIRGNTWTPSFYSNLVEDRWPKVVTGQVVEVTQRLAKQDPRLSEAKVHAGSHSTPRISQLQ